MSESSKITINADGISAQQKATAKFQSAYQDMLFQLSAPGFIPVLCAHEAAHLVFFTMAGLKEYEPRPASLVYDPKIDDYVGHLAAIQMLDMSRWDEGDFWPWFHRVACGHAAGGVVARKLMPSSPGGDDGDKDQFKELCDKLNTDPNISIDFEEWWKRAQETVARILEEHPPIMDAIREQALALQKEFGL
ncbi:MAG TPA: hypothetical protein VIJ01_18430 [Candidatus Angelobacter sp.]